MYSDPSSPFSAASSEVYPNSTRSFLNMESLLTIDNGVMLICGYDDSRSIYVETINAENKRTIFHYNLAYSTDPWEAYTPVAWTGKPLTNNEADFTRIKARQKNSHTAELYEVTRTNLCTFIDCLKEETLNKEIVNGVQNEAIITALTKINETIEFKDDFFSIVSNNCALL